MLEEMYGSGRDVLFNQVTLNRYLKINIETKNGGPK